MAEPGRQRVELDEEQLQLVYGRWDRLLPAQVDQLLAGSGVRWWIAGGRAARVGAAERRHGDTDVAVRMADLPGLREQLRGWHLWEAHDGTLRPLVPGDPLRDGREQLWVRQDAEHRWALDVLLDRSPDDAWVFKKDRRVRVPWDRALQVVGGIRYLRPELALLHKAHLDRAKDRADLDAATLTPEARRWLAATLEQLGHQAWAERLG